MSSESVAGAAPNGAVPGESAMATACRAMGASCGQAKRVGDEAATFIRTQPFAAALIALTIGYILGRLRV